MHHLWPIDPGSAARHLLHRGDRAWPESNCYVDVWVGLLHAAGLEPLAALPFTVAADFEGDQWTLFKFPLADLYALYGIDVFELQVWRPLVDHIDEQLALGRPVIVEVDAFHLPDTAGTTYQSEHVKTSIGIQALNRDSGRLGYFHNAGYHELGGGDFAGLFRLDEASRHPDHLPPYVEVAKLNSRPPLAGRELLAHSLQLLGSHLARCPRDNPFRRYARRFEADLSWLAEAPLTDFHNYAFATLRQCGAAFELAGAYLRWLQANGEPGLDRIADGCDVISTTAKALQFKTARLVHGSRRFDPGPMLETMAVAWDAAIADLTERYSATVHQG